MAHINGMIVQSSGSKKHVVHIMETLAKTFPYTIWKIGGKVDREKNQGGRSDHASGRACDIYLDAYDPIDKQLGDLLFEMFHRNGVDLKVDHIIWNKHIWSQAKGGPRSFTRGNGGPHTNHIHVSFKNDSLNTEPARFATLCKMVHAKYQKAAPDRAEGVYGQAFNSRRPNKRLSDAQRHKIMLVNMGMLESDPQLKLYKAARGN